MRPETWYQIFWVSMGLAFGIYNAILTAAAVAAGIVVAARYLGWTK